MAALITGSALERVAACPGSVALPHVRTAGSEHASRGTAIHLYLQRALEVGRPAALDEVEDESLRLALSSIDIASLPAADQGQWLAEVALAYNPLTDTARELGRQAGHRDYGALGRQDDEIPITLDVVGVTADSVVVLDYKTGHKSVAAAASNWQLGLGALAAARAYGRENALVGIIYVREERHYYDVASIDFMGLEEWAEKVRLAQSAALRAWAAAQSGTVPDVREGEHCRYCPAFVACPAKTRLLSALGSDPGSLVATTPSPITPEVAAVAYRRLQNVEQAVKQVREQLYAYATVSPIDLGDGMVFGPVESAREQLDGAVARQALLDAFGQLAADRASEWEVTKSSIKKAAQSIAMERGGAKVAPIERELLEAVRAAGGVNVKHSTTTKEHRRKAG